MSIDFRKSNFNSAGAGSAWVLFARPGPTGDSGPPQIQASQGLNVYQTAQENIRYRYGTLTTAAARARGGVENQALIAAGSGTGGAITLGDLAMLKVIIDSFDFATPVGRDQLNGMMNLIQEAITANRMTGKVMSLLWWFAFGVGASIPWYAYACPEDAIFPALGVAPPTPGDGALVSPLTIANTKSAIPEALRTADYATMPDSAATAFNAVGQPPGTSPAMDWMPYLMWGGIILAAIAAAVVVFLIVRARARKKQLEAGGGSAGRLPSGSRSMATRDPVAHGYTVAHEPVVA